MIRILSKNCRYLEQMSLPRCQSLIVKRAKITKASRDGRIIGPSLFGVAIQSFTVSHDETKCRDKITIHSYRIGTEFGKKEINGLTVYALKRNIYQQIYLK